MELWLNAFDCHSRQLSAKVGPKTVSRWTSDYLGCHWLGKVGMTAVCLCLTGTNIISSIFIHFLVTLQCSDVLLPRHQHNRGLSEE